MTSGLSAHRVRLIENKCHALEVYARMTNVRTYDQCYRSMLVYSRTIIYEEHTANDMYISKGLLNFSML